MAAAASTPRVRMMAICDGVRESLAESGVFHLKGLRLQIRSPGFPFVPSRLWLFLLFSSIRDGEYTCYIRVVNDRTDRTVFYSYLEPRPKFPVAGQLLASRVPIRCAFPEAGRYTMQVWFFQEDGRDVLKGEMPFDVIDRDEQQ